VENTLVIRSLPCSIQTQSVNVPPVSMAIRSGSFDDLEADAAMAE
jgi:hypothetical protein